MISWHGISGAPIGEMPPGGRYECYVATKNRVCIGIYCESLFGTWRWVDRKGRKIHPLRFAEIPQGWEASSRD
jgi:hypothetical protein